MHDERIVRRNRSGKRNAAGGGRHIRCVDIVLQEDGYAEQRTVDCAGMPARIDVHGIEIRVRVDVYVRVDVRARVFIGRHACVVHVHELLGGHELRL